MDEEYQLEEELSEISTGYPDLQVKTTKSKKDLLIEYTIPKRLINSAIYNNDITFIISLCIDKFPYSSPKLFCVSQFCFPHFADGRDILEEVLTDKWNEQCNVKLIIENTPSFIEKCFSQSDQIYIGKYYLGEKYDSKIFEMSNVDIANVKENIIINGTWTKYQRTLVISEVYFLLFEPDKKNKNKLVLMFWAPINSILVIKNIVVNKMLFIHWKQKDIKDPYEMCLTLDKGEEIVSKLLERMQNFGLNYNISKDIKKDM